MPMLLEIKIPVLKQGFRDALTSQSLAVVRLDLPLPVLSKAKIVEVASHCLHVLPTTTQDLYHDFGRSPYRARDLRYLPWPEPIAPTESVAGVTDQIEQGLARHSVRHSLGPRL